MGESYCPGDRLLANVAIQEAVNAGVSPKKIDQARKSWPRATSNQPDQNARRMSIQASMGARTARDILVKRSLGRGEDAVEILGDAGQVYVIEASTNLSNWAILATRTADHEGVIAFEDVEAAASQIRFYRVREP